MGLTASQGRLLMLTSRLSDIQLDMTLASQRQMALAWESEKEAKEYNAAMSNMKLVMKVADVSEKLGYRKTDVTYSDMKYMGYLVTDSQNRIWMTKEDIESNAINKFFDEEVVTDEDGNKTITVKGTTYKIEDGTEFLSDTEKLQNNLMNGLLYVMNTSEKNTGEIEINNLEANTDFEWVYDTSDDAEAESKHEVETARISRQENMLELEIKQLETQHNAILKEIESEEKVIDNNIERTYKLFENG